MKILICGDVVGKSGRLALKKNLPILKKKEQIDFVVVNGENAASGFGITKKICEEFYEMGIDVITTGNHIWDQREIIQHIETDNRLIRPCNYPEKTPGRGFGIYEIGNGSIAVVINVMCRLYMDTIENPFLNLDRILDEIKLYASNCLIIVDVHGESTSEKMAIGHFLDGRVTAVVGTHTHIPTSDLQIMEKGTFYQTDLGMCGDYNSIIGMKKEISLKRFLHKHLRTRLEPADGEGTVCGVILEIDQETKKVKNFKQLINDGFLGI